MSTHLRSARSMRCAAAVVLVLFAAFSCKRDPAGLGPTSCGEGAVLFVGNSLTYVNNLPGMVAGLSAAAGDNPPIRTAAVAFPNYSLEDHWYDGNARNAIASGNCSIVVLQQGPSSLPDSRVHLIDWTERFAQEIQAAGAEPTVYMVWPPMNRADAFQDVSDSYRLAAEAVDARLFPAGEAWRAAWRLESRLELYGPDGFHPSVLGTYTAAVVIYSQLSGRSPVGLPRTFQIPGGGAVLISETEAATVQAAAAEAIQAFGR